MSENNKNLTNLQLAAALAEMVYRRSENNFAVNLENDLGAVFLGRDVAGNNPLPAIPAWRGQQLYFVDNYYYNPNTGFVGSIVTKGTDVFVVFRGTDSAQSAFDSTSPFNVTGVAPGSSISNNDILNTTNLTDLGDRQSNQYLAYGPRDLLFGAVDISTHIYNQLDDAMWLTQFARLNAGAKTINVVGQSLGDAG